MLQSENSSSMKFFAENKTQQCYGNEEHIYTYTYLKLMWINVAQLEIINQKNT